MVSHYLQGSQLSFSYGIVLSFDPLTESIVRLIWRDLAQSGITSTLPSIVCAHPHLTLGFFKEMDRVAVRDTLATLATSIPPFKVRLASLGIFPTPAGSTVFLAPTVTSGLLAVQDVLFREVVRHARIPSEHYIPGKWVPHCSLGINLPRSITQQAVDYCLQLELPIEAQIVSLGLLEMVSQQQQVVSGCHLEHFSLGCGSKLPIADCPADHSCLFWPRRNLWQSFS